jgi:hypothetical protein
LKEDHSGWPGPGHPRIMMGRELEYQDCQPEPEEWAGPPGRSAPPAGRPSLQVQLEVEVELLKWPAWEGAGY